MFAKILFEENLNYERSTLDKLKYIVYNVFTMKNTIIVPNQIIQEADNLSKESGIPFRSCLEVLYKAYLEPMPPAEPQEVCLIAR